METVTITQAERRSLGRFDTPRPLAQALADWGVRSPTDRVLEPSCGSGVVVKSIIARFNELGVNRPSKQICACDIDQRAIDETARQVAPCNPKLVLRNFLETELATFGSTRFNAILGNPPYVRLHAMSASDRNIAKKSLPSPDLLDAKASLWAYFPIHAFKMLALGGRMGLILPEIILHSGYGKQVLNWAKQHFEKCVAVSLRERCFLADGAKERVVILLLAGAGGKAAREIEMVEYATAADCIIALPRLAQPNSPNLPQLNGHAVPHLISHTASTAAEVLGASVDFKKFEDFAEVKIGVVTGNNKFFVLSEENRLSTKLRKRHFQPIIGKFSQLGEGFVFAEKENSDDLQGAWLLCPDPKSKDRRLAEHLETYPEKDIEDNQTMEKRPHWQTPIVGVVPDAFLQYMGNYGPRMILNEAGYYCTNTIHRVFFKKNLARKRKRAICLCLHSSYSQLSAEFEGRQYGSGVLKLEPSEVKRLIFPYNEALVSALSRQWNTFCEEALERGWDSLVPKIDNIVTAHCPNLARTLPLESVRTLLFQVRQRRNSRYLLSGT